jgi:hypothetical protein
MIVIEGGDAPGKRHGIVTFAEKLPIVSHGWPTASKEAAWRPQRSAFAICMRGTKPPSRPVKFEACSGSCRPILIRDSRRPLRYAHTPLEKQPANLTECADSMPRLSCLCERRGDLQTDTLPAVPFVFSQLVSLV